MGFTKETVRPEVAREVLQRDLRCIAPLVDPAAGPCRMKWGQPVTQRIVDYWARLLATDRFEIDDQALRDYLTLDHVPPTPGAPRISTPRWLVTICWGHHGSQGGYWETAHRDHERDYLADYYHRLLGPVESLRVETFNSDDWAEWRRLRSFSPKPTFHQ